MGNVSFGSQGDEAFSVKAEVSATRKNRPRDKERLILMCGAGKHGLDGGYQGERKERKTP